MEKTILKLYENGDFETVNTPLTQSGVSGNYKFTENAITVPKVIEYPPTGYRNYFIEKTSVPGYIYHDWIGNIKPGDVAPSNENGRTSDFINITGWGNGVTRIVLADMDASYQAWVCILGYNASKTYTTKLFEDYVFPVGTVGTRVFQHTFPANVSFIRISVNYYDHPTVNVKVSIERGTTATPKHYLAFEDMPEWVVDTGNPVSIFPEGIVIKGDLIQSDS